MTDLQIRWQPVAQVNRNSIPPALLGCLLHTGSLTRFLETWCRGYLELQLENQSWQKPLFDESMALDLGTGRHGFIREICFTCDNVPWVYGRSIFPPETVSGAERRLANWGQRPLGNYLFSGRNILRGRIEVARVIPGTALHERTGKYRQSAGDTVWARRSIFYIRGKPLLVIEVFLDSLVKCIKGSKRQQR